MSIEPASVKHERTQHNYGILLADGSLRGSDGEYPWTTSSANSARNEIFDEISTMKKAHIPENMWPRIVKVKRTVTYHDVEEIKEEA